MICNVHNKMYMFFLGMRVYADKNLEVINLVWTNLGLAAWPASANAQL